MRKVPLTIVAATIAMVSAPANAACRWTWDCSAWTCRQVPICQSPLDIPGPPPPSIPPIPRPTIEPLEVPRVPPVGTSECRKRYLCDGGECSWQTICR
jgi:hypothetical protein